MTVSYFWEAVLLTANCQVFLSFRSAQHSRILHGIGLVSWLSVLGSLKMASFLTLECFSSLREGLAVWLTGALTWGWRQQRLDKYFWICARNFQLSTSIHLWNRLVGRAKEGWEQGRKREGAYGGTQTGEWAIEMETTFLSRGKGCSNWCSNIVNMATHDVKKELGRVQWALLARATSNQKSLLWSRLSLKLIVWL